MRQCKLLPVSLRPKYASGSPQHFDVGNKRPYHGKLEEICFLPQKKIEAEI